MSTATQVAIRVDESTEVGMGHMSRCRALADALLKAHAQVSLYSRSIRPNTRAELESMGATVVDLMCEESFFQRDWRDTTVVVDGYHFDESYWRALLDCHPRRTVCIDDVRPIQYFADLVICYNEGVSSNQFHLAPNTRLLLGGRYLLLRPEIKTAAKIVRRRPCPRRVFMIAAGGTRQESWVEKMLKLQSMVEPSSPIWVLSGRRLQTTKIVCRSGLKRSRIRFFTNLSAGEMMRRYRQSRCLLTPASTLMLEAFNAGCPIISGWIAENQRNSLDWYAERRLIVNAGNLQQVSAKSLALAYSKARRQSGQMVRKQLSYAEHSQTGIHEVVQAILADGITLLET